MSRCTSALFGVLLVAITAAKPAAQGVTLAGDLIKDWKAQKDTMLRIADAMPEDKFGFRPTVPQRSYGEQILHVAGANIMLMKFLGAKATAPPINDADLKVFGLKAISKADILNALGDSLRLWRGGAEGVRGCVVDPDDQGTTVDWRSHAGKDGVLHARTHAGYLRADGGLFAAQRDRAAREPRRRRLTPHRDTCAAREPDLGSWSIGL